MTIQSFTRSKCQAFQRSKCQSRLLGKLAFYRLYFYAWKYVHKGWPGPDDLRIYFGFYVYLQRNFSGEFWNTIDWYGISGFPEERFSLSVWGPGYIPNGTWPIATLEIQKSGDTDSWTICTGLSKENPGPTEQIETGSGPTKYPFHEDGTLYLSTPHPVAPDPPLIDPNPEGADGDGPNYIIEAYFYPKWVSGS